MIYYKCEVCKKEYISQEFLDKHLVANHQVEAGGRLSKGWATPHGFIDAIQPITYKQACKMAKEQSEMIKEMRAIWPSSK